MWDAPLHRPQSGERTLQSMSDTAFPIQSQDAAHQKHLVTDAGLQKAFAIRYTMRFDGLYAYEAHSQFIDNGRIVMQYIARLVPAIKNDHAVTSGRIPIARGRRNQLFVRYSGVLIRTSSICSARLPGTRACRRLARRFHRLHAPFHWSVRSRLPSPRVFLRLRFRQLSGRLVGSDSVGNRRVGICPTANATRWVVGILSALFVAGILAFWLVAGIGVRFHGL